MPMCGPKLSSPLPQDLSVWSYLFASEYSPLSRWPVNQIQGYRDASRNQFLSYHEIKDLSTLVSSTISSRYSIEAGSKVVILAQNSLWWPIALFASIRLGAIVTGASPDYGVEEMSHILKVTRPELIWADESSFNNLVCAAEALDISTDRIALLDASHAGKATIQTLVAEGRTASKQVEDYKIGRGQSNKNICCYLSFTSGTTSRPKAVMISHHNVIAQMTQVQSMTQKNKPQVVLGVLPFFHITGLALILQVPISLNQEVVIMSKFDMKEMLETITTYACEELWLVPPILIRLANDAISRKYDLACVKQFNTGAAPLSQEIINKVAKLYPHVAFRQAWGMTEATGALTMSPPLRQTYAYAHTVGAPVPDTMLKIVDADTGAEVEHGFSGEIWAKGPQVTMGYFNNKLATNEVFDADGYYHTGDIGEFNTEGLLLITDRLKEMIKVKGVGVAPAELEDFLLGHPLVVDAAVIGVPHEYSGEVPKALVVLVSGAAPNAATAQILSEFVKSKKVRAKWLVGGIEFLAEIPKTSSGKILRRMLRDRERTKSKLRKIKGLL